MTREEAIAQVELVVRICKGHWLLGDADKTALSQKWQQLFDNGDFPNAMLFKVSLESTLGLPQQDISDGDWDGLYRRVFGIIFGNKNDCGQDVNQVIVQYDFDGVEREVPCPTCGTTIIFSVFFDVSG